ncbi:sodium-independent sulfate anion transporter-like isoform X2 [Daktulosphaira vitifoliae]|uniref:sodium-independent sulfate anion transporter-like isoform X2 n=1 Tax=Daktulosphaira vitifoliae TaxID=58002 RepID=UPI0021A9A22F|nr:sodium-independent sulfate anion transporter-like isoform X2 [Daktulosphaira vitifoliae]
MVYKNTCGNTMGTFLIKYLPILTWMPKYKPSDLLCDATAGITVALTLMPQAIAYASLAGLSPQFGLYSACFGGIMYIIFGSVRQITIGPTSIVALLTLNYVKPTLPSTAIILCFVSGIVELLCGIFHLGFVVEFVSLPVTGGYTSAAAVILASSQLKGLFGVSYQAKNCVEMWILLVKKINDVNLADTAMGTICIIVLVCLKLLKRIKFNSKGLKAKIYSGLIFGLTTGSNLLVVIVSATVAYFLVEEGHSPLALTGKIANGIPNFRSPFLDYEDENEKYTFFEAVSNLWPGIIIVPLVSILSTISIAKAFSRGNIINASQEMIALGICNIFGSFAGAMPVAGSMSRSALNNSTGVRTPLSSIFTSVLAMFSLTYLTPALYYIPKASLSAVLICAISSMLKINMVKFLWNTNKRDLLSFMTTFIACVIFDVEMGLLIGICFDLINLLYFNARPSITIEKYANTLGTAQWVVRPSSGLLFPAVDYIRQKILTELVLVNTEDRPKTIIIDCTYFDKTDFTAAQGMKSLKNELKANQCAFELANVKTNVEKILESVVGVKVICMPSTQEVVNKISHGTRC